MSREIKFRAYNCEINDWVDFIQDRENLIITHGSKELQIFGQFDHIKLMQYTGLKDKNSVEIYEGDIVTNDRYKTPMVVVWSNDKNEWLGSGLSWKIEDKTTHKNYTDDLLSQDSNEVIGNIYENKELLND